MTGTDNARPTTLRKVRDYVVVVGHGRSGTNLALDLFDCDLTTHCRNEVNELVGTSFTGLGDNMFLGDRPVDFIPKWVAAVEQAGRSNGVRDRFVIHKSHFRSRVRAKLGQTLVARTSLRDLVIRRKYKDAEEWPCPNSYYDLGALEQAVPILKILLSPAWIIEAHFKVPEQKVVHVIRRPEGFIQSWWSRYVMEISLSPEEIYCENLPSLQHIFKYFGTDQQVKQEYSLYNLVVSELWRWRYVNEVLLDKLTPSSRYTPVAYEDLMGNKLLHAEKLFDFASLNMTHSIRETIKQSSNTVFKPRTKDGLDSQLVADAIFEVMAGSVWRNALLRSEE